MKGRLPIAVSLVAVLTGCQSDYKRTVAEINQQQATREAEKLSAVAFADKQSSDARGTKTCHIKQYTSAHLAAQRMTTKAQTGYYVGSDMSEVFVRVYKDGAVGIAVTDDTYPGTDAYFLIDGHRYRADGDGYASVDAAGISALKRDALIKFSWTNWPYRNEINREDILAGFEAAYVDCLAFLRG